MDKIYNRELAFPAAGVHVRQSGEGEAPSRTIEGYAIMFDSLSAPLYEDDREEIREIIAPEAITRELLDNSDIKFTMYHDNRVLLGRSNKGQGTLSYDVDERGVSFTLELPDSPYGREALSAVSRGDISGCSFAFRARYGDPKCVEQKTETVDGKKRHLFTVRKIVGVYDFTLTPDPAYPSTSVDTRSLRDLIPTGPAKPDTAAIRARVKALRAEAKERIS